VPGSQCDAEADEAERRRILRDLLGAGGEDVWIQPPFFCDYGSNIYLGRHWRNIVLLGNYFTA
jgi:hypothetical protein